MSGRRKQKREILIKRKRKTYIHVNNPDTHLKDFIHVEKGIIPPNLCDYVVKDTETRDWEPHTWYNSDLDSFNSEKTMEIDVQNTTSDLHLLLTPHLIHAGNEYSKKYTYRGCMVQK